MVRIQLTLEQKRALAIASTPGWMAIVMVRQLSGNADAAASTDGYVQTSKAWLTRVSIDWEERTLSMWMDKVAEAKAREAAWSTRYPVTSQSSVSYAAKLLSNIFGKRIDAQVHHCFSDGTPACPRRHQVLLLQMWHSESPEGTLPLVVVESPVSLDDVVTVCFNNDDPAGAKAMYDAMPRFGYVKLTTDKSVVTKDFRWDYADILLDVLAARAERLAAASAGVCFGVGSY